MTESENLLRSLEKTLGPDRVERGGSSPFVARCRPASTEEVAAAVRLAAEHSAPLCPTGGGTALSYGNPPPQDTVLLSLERLSGMIAYEPADMVATAGAGTRFSDFQKAAAAHGQSLPLDAPPDSTLGGGVATNRSGPRRLAYGTWRDQVLGLTVVNGDGVVRKCGSRVVKNVTGYALERMYIGSLGTLGMVTEVTVKLRPRPESVRQRALESPRFQTGFELLRKWVSQWPLAAAVAGYSEQAFRGEILLEASPPDCERMLREMESSARDAGAELRELESHLESPGEGQPGPRHFGEAISDQPPLARLSWAVQSGSFSDQARQAAELGRACGLWECRIFLEFPSQMQVECFAQPGAQPDLDRMVRTLRSQGTPAAVTWRAPQAPLTEPAFGPPRPEWALMAKIKTALDPKMVLNPGRILNGL